MKIYTKIAATLTCMLICMGVANAEQCKSESYIPTTTDGELVVEKDGVIPISFVIDIPKGMIGIDNARVYRPYLVNGDWKMMLPTVIVKGYNYKPAKEDEATFKEESADKELYDKAHVVSVFKGVEIPYDITIDAVPEAQGAYLVVEGATQSLRRYQSNWIYRKEVDPAKRIDTLNLTNPYHNLKDTYQSTFANVEDNVTINQLMFMYPTTRKQVLAESFGERSVFILDECKLDKDAFCAPFEALAEQVAGLESKGAVINSVTINVTSSPDGPESKNLTLAKCRTDIVKALVEKHVPAFTPEITTYNTSAENWDAYIEAIKAKGLYNTEIKTIIEQLSDLDEREGMLFSTDYREDLIAICNDLRTCEVEVNYTMPTAVSKSTCKCGLNTVRVEAKSDVQFKLIAEDYKAGKSLESTNNAMVAATVKGDYEKAFAIYKELIKYELNKFTANNIGVMLSYVGDYPMAEHYFSKTECMKPAKSNLAEMYIMSGDYCKADKVYGECTCKNSIALKMAAGKFEDVVRLTADSGYEDADMLYIRALAYSQTQNIALTLFTLGQACELDSKYKDQAKSQPEFAKLRGNEAFEKIVK